MNKKVKAVFEAIILLTLLFVFDSQDYSQESTPSPSPAVPEATTAKSQVIDPKQQQASPAKSQDTSAETQDGVAKPQDAAAKPQGAPTKPAPKPKPEFADQEEMTGDWWGTRDRWKEKGFEVELKLFSFGQGIAKGGTNHDSQYYGKFETIFKFDFGKMAGWKFWSAEIRTETRWGGPLLTGTGSINPVNTAIITPGGNGAVFSITAVNVTKLFPLNLAKGNLIAVSAGRYNLLDLLDEDFFAGMGEERFQNIAPIGPLTVLRQVPLITNGASFAYIKGGEPRFTFALIDPNDHSLNPGLKDLFADGVTFYPSVYLPTKYWGRTAKHSVGFAITTKKYTPFDAIRQIIIPGPPLNPIAPQGGSWSLSYTFRQYIVERGHRDGWGFFTQLSTADKGTSPITQFVNLGIGGNGLFKGRPRDEFGWSYAFTDLSKVLKDNLNLISQGGLRPRAEHQVEMFYNFFLTPWLRLTGDLQIIRPTRRRANTAYVPGARVELIF